MENVKCILHGFQEDILMILLDVGANMLMETHNVNIIFFGYSYRLFNVSFVNPKFTLRASSDHVVSGSRSKLRVHSYENIFPL